MIISAPAKINLTLRVLGKRPDGYHALESVMQLIALADTLRFEEADEIVFSCSDPALSGSNNLVVRAAKLLQSRCPIVRGVHIHLDKVIPAQAGLGGGSSDAAATLSALNEFWQVRLEQDDLIELGAQLGSDVPFFLNGPSALVRGRGESVNSILHSTLCHIVLAKPFFGLSTPEVYANLQAKPYVENELRSHNLPESQAMISALKSGNIEAISRAVTNDLEGPALRLKPELFHLRERMLQEGCLSVLLCGSGSALFGICPDAETAQHAAIDLTNDAPWTWAGPWVKFR